MSTKIKRVTAYEYKSMLFRNQVEVHTYIRGEQENRKSKKYIQALQELNAPEKLTIKEGYFDFYYSTNGGYDLDKWVSYKKKSFKDALNAVLKRKNLSRIDCESEILDKNMRGTGFYVQLSKMPTEHPVHSFL